MVEARWNGAVIARSDDTVVVDGKENRDAAWYYPETKPKADNIRGRIAFWKCVEVG